MSMCSSEPTGERETVFDITFLFSSLSGFVSVAGGEVLAALMRAFELKPVAIQNTLNFRT
jgi:hypothetical protein